jgi:two-component system CheB/CheR fusion protein
VWSDETHRIFGIPRGTPLTYETFLGTVHSEDRDLVDRAWRAALEGAPYEVEHRIVVAGEVRWVRERAQLEADDAGALRGGFGTVQDITEQKQAEETLRQSEERFRTIFESAGAGIAQVDLRTSRVMRANRRFAAITGYTQAELEGMPYLDLTHPEERASAASALNRAWEDGDTHAGHFREGRYLRKDGTVIDLELYGSIIHDAADRPTHGIIVVADITERKRVERDLAAARISAEHAKAVAEEASRAKDHFLAVLSHELRTPLTPVLAGIALVERGTLSEEARHFLEVIRRNVELESRLIDDLLDLTRITRGKVELDKRLFELCTIIERAVDVCRPDIEARQLHFGIDWGPRPYVLYADGARLQQVFWNLLKNAIKFTPKGGCVGIRCRPDVAGVVVEVHDSGVGIERSAIGSIFDAFTQAQHSTARQFGGLGLGLTISKMLAEMHGGTIEARSEGPGRGSSFSVRLPIVSYGTARMSPDAAPSTRIEHHERTGTRVLLVEDHGDTAQTMVTVLEMAGYEVATAGDVATALDILDKQPFDLLISDLGLPDRSGLDLMRELRTRGSGLAGIALSGYGMESDMEQSRAAGFLAHLVKPVEPARLLEAMQKALPKVGVH